MYISTAVIRRVDIWVFNTNIAEMFLYKALPTIRRHNTFYVTKWKTAKRKNNTLKIFKELAKNNFFRLDIWMKFSVMRTAWIWKIQKKISQM
jgi:hypothetical protein